MIVLSLVSLALGLQAKLLKLSRVAFSWLSMDNRPKQLSLTDVHVQNMTVLAKLST